MSPPLLVHPLLCLWPFCTFISIIGLFFHHNGKLLLRLLMDFLANLMSQTMHIIMVVYVQTNAGHGSLLNLDVDNKNED